jgi:hypothetical protein
MVPKISQLRSKLCPHSDSIRQLLPAILNSNAPMGFLNSARYALRNEIELQFQAHRRAEGSNVGISWGLRARGAGASGDSTAAQCILAGD